MVPGYNGNFSVKEENWEECGPRIANYRTSMHMVRIFSNPPNWNTYVANAYATKQSKKFFDFYSNGGPSLLTLGMTQYHHTNDDREVHVYEIMETPVYKWIVN